MMIENAALGIFSGTAFLYLILLHTGFMFCEIMAIRHGQVETYKCIIRERRVSGLWDMKGRQAFIRDEKRQVKAVERHSLLSGFYYAHVIPIQENISNLPVLMRLSLSRLMSRNPAREPRCQSRSHMCHKPELFRSALQRGYCS